MPRKSKIIYNPKHSIAKNAKDNGVTEDAIRYYIKSHGIDRNYERKVKTVNKIRDYLKKNPKATKEEVSKKTKLSVTTVRKYWEYAKGKKELPNNGRNKTPKVTLREINNFYATHPSATRDIMREELFCHEILEPFCGSGSMAKVIQAQGHSVRAYDIIDRGYGEVEDFFNLSVERGRYDIISNPPYDERLNEIILKSISLCKHKVALLLPFRYLSGQSRHKEIYAKNPPARVYVYVERISIAKGAQFEKYDAGANMEIYAWYVWEKGYKGKTELKWIHNDTSVLLNEKSFDEVKILGDILFHPNEQQKYHLKDSIQFHSKALPENKVLSNHFDCIITFRGVEFYGLEQMYHALQFADSPDILRGLFRCNSTSASKSFCKEINDRRDWDAPEKQFRNIALCHLFKYLSYRPYRDRLRETYPADLVECPNGSDDFFACVQNLDDNYFYGCNVSGRTTMIVRNMMKELEDKAIHAEENKLGRELTLTEREDIIIKVCDKKRFEMEMDSDTIKDSQRIIDFIEKEGISRIRKKHPEMPEPIHYDENLCLIADFDETLFDTSADADCRKGTGAKNWDKIYACIPHYKLYEGWREVLAWLRRNNVKFGIITGAKSELVKRTLEHFGIECDCIIGYRQFYEKPNPILVNFAIDKLNVRPDNIISVGNSTTDERMSRGAGVRFLGAVWDSVYKDELENNCTTINCPIEIISYFKRLQDGTF